VGVLSRFVVRLMVLETSTQYVVKSVHDIGQNGEIDNLAFDRSVNIRHCTHDSNRYMLIVG
jgi:hypothetical protein